MNSESEILKTFGATPETFEPCAYLDGDGKCIEFFATNENFTAERLDQWVTVYRGEVTGEIVGSQIKDVPKLLKQYPGFDVEVEEGGVVRLSAYFRACVWKQGDPVVKRTYKTLLARAGEVVVVQPKAA